MPVASSPVDTRDRIVTAANELFRRQGFNGTSLSQIVKASGSTTGSVYHFFPGGKEELTAVALASSGAAYGEFVAMIIREADDPEQGMRDAFAGAAALLVETDFIDPCPIGTVAREVASTHESLRAAASSVMSGWVDTLATIFVEAGLGPAAAEPLATMCVASIEGGFVLARTHRDVTPFLTIGDMLCQSIANAFG